MTKDSINLVKTCTKCQIHANEHHIQISEYHTFGTSIPFAHWGIDHFGLFPKALASKNYLIVTIIHFTRWIEVKALASITTRDLKEFFYEDVICRFRIPKILISDNGKHFNSKEFKDSCEELSIEQRFTSVRYQKLIEQRK